jgi:hypothetical protein
MQLHSELAQNIQKDRVWRHMKTRNKEIFEHHRFVFLRIQNGLCTRRLAISFRKVMIKTLHRHNVGHSNRRLPKIIADASKSSLSPNLHAPAIVRGSFTIAGAFGLVFLVRPSTLVQSGLRRNDNLLASLRFFQLLSRGLLVLYGCFEHPGPKRPPLK